MVYGIPSVRVSSKIGYVPSLPADDQMFGTVLECTKGTPNEAVLIRSPEELYQEFKTHLDAYFGVGGQALYVVRAACDSTNPISGTAPTKSSQIFIDTTTTPQTLFTLAAKQPGTYKIYVTISQNGTGGNNVIIEEEGYSSEYYIGIVGIENLTKRINRESQIVDATFTSEGNGTCKAVVRSVLGASGTAGTDGDVKVGTTDGTLPTINAPTAHEKALAALEPYKLAGIFCTQVTEDTTDTVHAVYVEHIDKMNTPNEHGWRFGILGAPNGATKGEMITEASNYDRQNIAFVGQGVIDQNGTEYSPTEATQVVAGKIGATSYQETIWGGQDSKILGVDNEVYIIDALPLPGIGVNGLATSEDIIEYNEKGVITFLSDLSGVRIREGITTAQNADYSEEDELAVVRIVRHAKYLVYEKAYEMLGQGMTDTFKTDLEEHIKSGLEVMKTTDLALTDIPTSGLSAYSVSVNLVPRTTSAQGKVSVSASITPIHAARTIDAQITVM
ncbi:MAG: hypothetical protein LLG05_09110 [Porphyromonadaceae bacterium]|nr:hypothetical protein [Porphyromonadaceae bacterium]